jgi:hypothetical protein
MSTFKIDYNFNPRDGSFRVNAPTPDISRYISTAYNNSRPGPDDRENENKLRNIIDSFVDEANANRLDPQDFKFSGGSASVRQQTVEEPPPGYFMEQIKKEQKRKQGWFLNAMDTVIPSIAMARGIMSGSPMQGAKTFAKTTAGLMAGRKIADIASNTVRQQTHMFSDRKQEVARKMRPDVQDPYRERRGTHYD